MDESFLECGSGNGYDIDGYHVVAVGAPVPRRRQDRARARCLERLVVELSGARYNLPKGTPFHLAHLPGRAEPLLWVADVVAGAARLSREGDHRAKALLAPRLLEIAVDTGC